MQTKNKLYFMYAMYITYGSGTCESQRRVTDHLDLEKRMVMRHQLVTGSEVGSSVLCKNSNCS